MAQKHRLNKEDHLRFLLAGKCFVTFLNTLTGKRFTYKIGTGDSEKTKDMHFVSVLHGPDNAYNYKYVGTIFNKKVFRHTTASKVIKTDIRWVVFDYVFRNVLKDTLPKYVEIWHNGRCARCGKSLTVPDSIKSGFGSACLKLVTEMKQKSIQNKLEI